MIELVVSGSSVTWACLFEQARVCLSLKCQGVMDKRESEQEGAPNYNRIML